jgi:hypothetical protein
LQLTVSHEDEGRYEALAVGYAASRNGLPQTDLLMGSGGGSVQISTDLGLPEMKLYGIELGFRKGQKMLLEKVWFDFIFFFFLIFSSPVFANFWEEFLWFFVQLFTSVIQLC